MKSARPSKIKRTSGVRPGTLDDAPEAPSSSPSTMWVTRDPHDSTATTSAATASDDAAPAETAPPAPEAPSPTPVLPPPAPAFGSPGYGAPLPVGSVPLSGAGMAPLSGGVGVPLSGAALAPLPAAGFPQYVPSTHPGGQPIPQPPRVAPRSNPGQPVLSPPDPRLENPPVTGLPPASPKQSSPIRETSASISYFNRRAGDASRYVFLIVLTVGLGLLAFIFFFPKELPDDADAATARANLPAELIREAMRDPQGPTLAMEDIASATAARGAASDRVDPGAGPAATAAAAGEPPDLRGPRAPSSGEAAVASATGASPPSAVAMTAAAPMVTGRLRVDTDPRVSVFVEDQGFGRTPVDISLPAGKHRIRLTDRSTGINAYRTIRVRPGRLTERAFSFGTCQLRVNAPDGALVKLNARVLGTAPLEEQTVYEGRYLLRVTYLGAVWSERIEVPAGGRLTYTVSLKDAPR